MVENFGLLNDLFPFPSILDAAYPVFNCSSISPSQNIARIELLVFYSENHHF